MTHFSVCFGGWLNCPKTPPPKGKVGIDWKEYALGIGQTRRKTVGLGRYDKRERQYEFEMFIRELSIVDAGLGCAVWDAAIILARWVWENAALFQGKSVLELGSGVGLPGILAAAFAQRVTLTDYVEPVLDNLAYNVALNGQPTDEEQSVQRVCQWRANIKGACTVMPLDWDKIDEMADVPQYDIVLGSELTYSPLSVHNLVKVIQRTLKPDGWFLEILSEDRDGVSLFVQVATERGFQLEHDPVPDHMYGKFGTKQRPEKYRFYRLQHTEASLRPSAALPTPSNADVSHTNGTHAHDGHDENGPAATAAATASTSTCTNGHS